MAITPSKVDFSNINEVQNGQGITPEHINNPLKASALAQAVVTNDVDTTDIDKVGTPTFQIINDTNPHIKVSHLKGATGAKIVSISEVGTDDSGGIVYQMNFDGAPPATFVSPPPTKLMQSLLDWGKRKMGK